MMDTSYSNGSDGFFATVASGFSSGLSTFGSSVLPNWASKQLTGQTIDKTATQPTYNADNAPPRLDSNAPTTGQAAQIAKKFPLPTMLLIGAGVLLTVVLIKVVK